MFLPSLEFRWFWIRLLIAMHGYIYTKNDFLKCMICWLKGSAKLYVPKCRWYNTCQDQMTISNYSSKQWTQNYLSHRKDHWGSEKHSTVVNGRSVLYTCIYSLGCLGSRIILAVCVVSSSKRNRHNASCFDVLYFHALISYFQCTKTGSALVLPGNIVDQFLAVKERYGNWTVTFGFIMLRFFAIFRGWLAVCGPRWRQ